MTIEHPPYAVKYCGHWFIAYLVTADCYSAPENKAHWQDEPVWSEAYTTAYICEHPEAEEAILLGIDT